METTELLTKLKRLKQALCDAHFVLEGSVAIEGQDDEDLMLREKALERFLQVFMEEA